MPKLTYDEAFNYVVARFYLGEIKMDGIPAEVERVCGDYTDGAKHAMKCDLFGKILQVEELSNDLLLKTWVRYDNEENKDELMTLLYQVYDTELRMRLNNVRK